MSEQYGRTGSQDDGEPGNYVLRALQVLAGYGDAEAVVQAGSRLTYTEVVDTTLALAAALYEKGVRAGDGVAMLVRNCPESASLQLALHLLGCRTLWIAHYEPLRMQIEFFEFAKARVLIYTAGLPRREEMATELARRDPSRLVLALGQGDGPGEDLLAALSAQAPPLDSLVVGPEPESLFYSGGTTGRSKLVRHGQRFYEMMMDIAEYYLSIGEPPMRFLTTSAFTH
ncbi:MAG TPA: AMP-binding protein, partial [Streptosporangiaceae bacterium]|nr:AMP-binding protein [Streptosporangiaceae bacterium]